MPTIWEPGCLFGRVLQAFVLPVDPWSASDGKGLPPIPPSRRSPQSSASLKPLYCNLIDRPRTPTTIASNEGQPTLPHFGLAQQNSQDARLT